MSQSCFLYYKNWFVLINDIDRFVMLFYLYGYTLPVTNPSLFSLKRWLWWVPVVGAYALVMRDLCAHFRCTGLCVCDRCDCIRKTKPCTYPRFYCRKVISVNVMQETPLPVLLFSPFFFFFYSEENNLRAKTEGEELVPLLISISQEVINVFKSFVPCNRRDAPSSCS